MNDSSQRRLPNVLIEAGYRCALRSNGWIECLIWHEREPERWLGRGGDESTAIVDALSQMFPSAAARTLLSGQLAEGDLAPARPAAVPQLSTPTRGAPIHPLPTAQSIGVKPTPVRPVISRQLAVAAAPRNEPMPTVGAAYDALEDIFREIEDARPELALMAPRLQKRLMVAWICRTRSYDELFAGESRVTTGVRRIARVLTDLSKTLWPGSVRALQMNALPECALQEIETSEHPNLATWSDASRFVDQFRAAHPDIADPALDIYGWADSESIGKDPARADALLQDARVAVERVAGNVSAFPPHHRQCNPEDISQETIVGLAVHVQRLRWIRTCIIDPELWGATIGRLRWLAGRLGQRAIPLRKFLDPEYRPQDTWSRLLGQDNGPAEESPLAALTTKVREHLDGRPALYVSHRDEPLLKDKLNRSLGLNMTWCNGDDSDQRKAASEAIKAGAYKLMIAGTRFQGSRIDAPLVRLARDCEVPYIRIYAGNLDACTRALARRHNLLPAAE